MGHANPTTTELVYTHLYAKAEPWVRVALRIHVEGRADDDDTVRQVVEGARSCTRCQGRRERRRRARGRIDAYVHTTGPQMSESQRYRRRQSHAHLLL